MPYHFGVKVVERKRGLKLTRETYAIVNNRNSLPRFSQDIYADEEGKTYTEEWCKQQLEDCLKNYDLNMEYFSSLNHDEFCKEIRKFLIRNQQFKEVSDLNIYDGKSGYYLMVLDAYSQAYIGTTSDIKKRIREHWSASKPFDRLLFPMGNINSILSIDSFRALDTTRIYAYETNKTYSAENNFMNQIPSKFVCNRISGGKIPTVLTSLEAMAIRRKRNLEK